jgi:hypothetical protein
LQYPKQDAIVILKKIPIQPTLVCPHEKEAYTHKS